MSEGAPKLGTRARSGANVYDVRDLRGQYVFSFLEAYLRQADVPPGARDYPQALGCVQACVGFVQGSLHMLQSCFHFTTAHGEGFCNF